MNSKELQAKWKNIAADKGMATANKYWFFTVRGVKDFMFEHDSAFAAEYQADAAIDKQAVMIGWMAGFDESVFADSKQFRDGLEEGTLKAVTVEAVTSAEVTPFGTAYEAAIAQIRTEGFYEAAGTTDLHESDLDEALVTDSAYIKTYAVQTLVRLGWDGSEDANATLRESAALLQRCMVSCIANRVSAFVAKRDSKGDRQAEQWALS